MLVVVDQLLKYCILIVAFRFSHTEKN